MKFDRNYTEDCAETTIICKKIHPFCRDFWQRSNCMPVPTECDTGYCQSMFIEINKICQKTVVLFVGEITRISTMVECSWINIRQHLQNFTLVLPIKFHGDFFQIAK